MKTVGIVPMTKEAIDAYVKAKWPEAHKSKVALTINAITNTEAIQSDADRYVSYHGSDIDAECVYTYLESNYPDADLDCLELAADVSIANAKSQRQL